jgi:16S rRNA (cytosine1402-N4)-methyltransferase
VKCPTSSGTFLSEEQAVDTPWQHTTVLLNEAVEALLNNTDTHADAQADTYAEMGAPERISAFANGCFVDATYGRGGHSRLLLSKLGPQARLIAFDKDLEAVAAAQAITDARFSIRHEGFKGMAQLPAASVAGILMDLGISSPQIDQAQRGFSFRFDAPLDMRMDTSRGQTAAQWLATASSDNMAEVIRDYGEERFAGAIAKAIVARRQARGPISTTFELAQLVADTVKTREPGQNPATRTFQAIRIYINAELEELQQALEASLDVLQPGGRLVVISFHSLEDRIVKQFIAQHSREVFDRRAPFAAPKAMKLKALGRIKPGAAEVAANPRSRSAVMRIAQRTTA